MQIDLVKWRHRLMYLVGDAVLLAWLPNYLKFQRNLENPLRQQKKKLLAILMAHKDTAFGKKCG